MAHSVRRTSHCWNTLPPLALPASLSRSSYLCSFVQLPRIEKVTNRSSAPIENWNKFRPPECQMADGKCSPPDSLIFITRAWREKSNLKFFAGYFWHITDLHLDTTYSVNGDVLKSKCISAQNAFIQTLIVRICHSGCRHIEHHQSNSATRKPGRFGDYLCDSPWSLLESAAQAMKSRQGDNVEFVLWTG